MNAPAPFTAEQEARIREIIVETMSVKCEYFGRTKATSKAAALEGALQMLAEWRAEIRAEAGKITS